MSVAKQARLSDTTRREHGVIAQREKVRKWTGGNGEKEGENEDEGGQRRSKIHNERQQAYRVQSTRSSNRRKRKRVAMARCMTVEGRGDEKGDRKG